MDDDLTLVSEWLWCTGDPVVAGEAHGPLLVLQEPVSFWGGVDDETGQIIDSHHPQFGQCLAGVALLMGATRGSSSSTSTFLECVRQGTAPAVLLLTDTDPILVVAAAAAREIYGHGTTVVVLREPPQPNGVTAVRVDNNGNVFALGDGP